MIAPNYRFRKVFDIPVVFLLERGLRHLVLDVDNTLTTNNHPTPSQGVAQWLQDLQDAGITAIILSNNKPGRVKPFAEILGLPYEANAGKPGCAGFERCRQRFDCKKDSMAVVGDQLLTDIWGGGRYGIVSILVDPIKLEDFWLFKMKRGVERLMLRKLSKKGKLEYER